MAKQNANGSKDAEASELNIASETHGKADVVMSDLRMKGSPGSSPDRKRKREDYGESADATPSETPSLKRIKEDSGQDPTPPLLHHLLRGPSIPPLSEEERSMREQEEALMRENEEAQRLEDEEQSKKLGERGFGRENETAEADFARSQPSGPKHCRKWRERLRNGPGPKDSVDAGGWYGQRAIGRVEGNTPARGSQPLTVVKHHSAGQSMRLTNSFIKAYHLQL